MFTNSEEYLNLAFIWDNEISTAILRETGEIFLLLYFAVSLLLNLFNFGFYVAFNTVQVISRR